MAIVGGFEYGTHQGLITYPQYPLQDHKNSFALKYTKPKKKKEKTPPPLWEQL